MISRARLRRYAACVLALWVFGLATGFANACVVAADVRHAAHSLTQAARQAHGHAHEDAVGAGHQSAPRSADQQPCERLCAEPTTASRHEKQNAILAGFFVVAPAVIQEMPLPPRPPMLLANAAPGPLSPVPLAIAYVRLTL